MNIDDLMGGEDLKKFRIVTGYGKFDSSRQCFRAKPHHMIFYAKDHKVLNFMVVMARMPQGQLVQELDGDFPVCLN